MTRLSKEAAQMTEADTQQEEIKPRRKRGVTAHLGLRLDAPKREGWVRRWVNADPARLRAMEDLGYQPVQDKAADGSSRTDGGGTRIERHTGKDGNGHPTYQVLMETPAEEYQKGIADKDAPIRAFEQAIAAGRDTTGKLEDGYAPRGTSSSIETSRYE